MKPLVLLLTLALTSAMAEAQTTLEACRRLAREHYPEIRQYNLIDRTEACNFSNAARAWLPQVTVGAQTTWQNEVMALPSALTGMLSQWGTAIPGLKREQYKAGVEVNQTLWDGGQWRAARRLAETEANEQRRAADVDLYAVEGRVDELYFSILLLDERIARTEATQTLLQGTLEKLRALVARGAAMQADADAVEAEWLAAGQQRTNLAALRAVYLQMLELFAGCPLPEPLQRPAATLPSAGPSARPELSLFDATLGRLAARADMVKVASRPRLALFAQGSYGYPGFNYFESMKTGDATWNLLAGVRFSWNIGAFNTQRNELEKLRVAGQEVEMKRDIFRFDTELQTARENGEIARLRKIIADDDRIVALRRTVREAAESKLRNGIIDTNDLLGKITDEATACAARSEHEIELLKHIYALRHTINR